MPTPSDVARALHRVIEPIVNASYFAPESKEAYEAIGLEPVAQGYVAGRAAPLGPVGPAVSGAIFFNFSPAIHEMSLPGAWDIASPAQVLDARWSAMQAFGDRVEVPVAGIEEATELAEAAAGFLDLAGRPLAAANAALELPEAPYAALWQVLSTIREHRGDGHVALLTGAGMNPVEVLVVSTLWQPGLSRKFLQFSRVWSDEAWTEAEELLRERGWLDDAGEALTAEGKEWRDEIEELTDELASDPWAELGDEDSEALFLLLRPITQAVIDSGRTRQQVPEHFPA